MVLRQVHVVDFEGINALSVDESEHFNEQGICQCSLSAGKGESFEPCVMRYSGVNLSLNKNHECSSVLDGSLCG